MEHTGSQAPPEITISTSPRSSSFFDRVLRRTASGSQSASRIPTLNLPAEVPSTNNTLDNTSPRPHSRSSSRSSHKRAPLTIDTSIASATMMPNKKSKSTHLTVVETTASRSSSRSRSRSRSRARSPSPNIEMMRQSSRVASINHVGRHTNDWLFGGFHLTSKIGAPRGRAK